MGVYPDALAAGFAEYRTLKQEHIVYEFLCTYVRRIMPDNRWKKKMRQYAGSPFLHMITPSDIAYVCAIIKNGNDVWDQSKRRISTPDAEPEKKMTARFSTGKGKKRESGKSVWNDEGLEFYYQARKNWKDVWNNKEEFTALVNGWEKWEPMDKSKKDPLRTVWIINDGKKAHNERADKYNQRWEEEEGYGTDFDLAGDFEWDDDVKKRAEKKVRERLIVESKGKYDPWEEKDLEEDDSDTEKAGENEEGSKNQDEKEVEEEGEDENENEEDTNKHKKAEQGGKVKAVRASSRKRTNTVKD